MNEQTIKDAIEILKPAIVWVELDEKREFTIEGVGTVGNWLKRDGKYVGSIKR